MRKFIAAAVAIVGTASTAMANPILMDFESFTPNYSNPNAAPGELTSLVLGLGGATGTLTRTGGLGFDIFDSFPQQMGLFPESWGNKHLSPFANSGASDAFNIDFTGVTVTGVSIEYGDFGGDLGNVRFQAFSGADGTGMLLSDQTQSWSSDFEDGDAAGVFTFSSATAIGSIRFWGEMGDFPFPNSLYWDNLMVTLIPLPPAVYMGFLGFGLMVVVTRRFV